VRIRRLPAHDVRAFRPANDGVHRPYDAVQPPSMGIVAPVM
jgi:hypothetical protein